MLTENVGRAVIFSLHRMTRPLRELGTTAGTGFLLRDSDGLVLGEVPL